MGVDSWNYHDEIKQILSEQEENIFNQYTIVYSSDKPVKGTITYQMNGIEIKETFFLKSGSDIPFTSLIDSYPSGGTAQKITELVFVPVQHSETEFCLKQVKTEKRIPISQLTDEYGVETDSDGTIYLENERYKLGILLTWGGGISYFEDKENSAATGILNLFNRADPGRLVQQSYYGTQSWPYVTGDSFHKEWPYNPVQGGDQYMNHSKIVDFRIDGNRLYTKTQPLDWAHNNQLTPFYMENTYILTRQYVQVLNRFEDFSGYFSSPQTQELPAFYVISYLGDFVYYGGDMPWTGDAVTRIKELPFWGDESAVDRCTFYSNLAESWCAWLEENGDYGVGLYVPNVNMLRAGRYEFDGSKEAMSNSTNYVAPLKSMQMQSFRPIEYSYIFCAGELNEIRKVFENKKEFHTNASLDYEAITVDSANFQFGQNSSNLLIYSGGIQQTKLCAETIHLKLEVTENGLVYDPFINLDWKYLLQELPDTEQYPYIVLTSMAPSKNTYESYDTEIFLKTGDCYHAEAGRSVVYSLPADDKYHAQILDLSSNINWKGVLNGLRLDYFSDARPGDVYYLYSLNLAQTEQEAERIAEQMEMRANAVTE